MHGQQPSELKISKKKTIYPVSGELKQYLLQNSREIEIPIKYDDLLRFNEALAVYDKKGKDSLWETAIYNATNMEIIHEGLKQIYSILKTEGDSRVHKHLH